MNRYAMLMVLVVGSTSAFGGPAHAQGTAGADALRQYRAQALETRFSLFNGLKLHRAGKPVELGFFGGNAESIFADSPAALDRMGTYRTLRITGTALWAVGLAALVTEIVLLLAKQDLLIESHSTGNEVKPLFWGLFIPGVVVGLTGGMIMQGANSYLSDAVVKYNDDLSDRLLGNRPAAHARGAVLSYRGRF